MSEVGAFECPRCGKDCTNKSGLASHRKRCEAEMNLNCDYCQLTFSSKPNLVRHMTTCKKYRDFLTEEEHKKVKTQLEKTYEEKIKELNDLLCKRQKDHELILSSLADEHQRELQKTIKELKQDTECQVKLRETDLISATNELAKLKENDLIITSERELLKRKVEEGEKEIRYLTHKVIDQSSQIATLSLGSTNITNNTISQVQNNVQLQMFDPSVIKGRIHPPEMMVSSVPQLVNHLFRLGAGNYFRVTDKSRHNTIWNKS